MRPPTPTYLKLIAGNPGKRPINKEEPLPEGEIVDLEPPRYMTHHAKTIWKEIIDFAPPGLLKHLDSNELARYCIACELFVKAYREIKKNGTTYKTKSGEQKPSPYVAILNSQSQIMNVAGGNLGFNPSARTRIKLTLQDKDKNKFDELKQKHVNKIRKQKEEN